MNLAALMNDGTGEQEQRKSPENQRSSQAPAPPGSTAQQYNQTPLYPPPPASRPSQSQGLTPLHTQTPSQAPGSGQYPFPQAPAPAQSPASSQQYRPYDAFSATTPSARPTSHGYYPLQSPAHMGAPGVPKTSSLSPTPPSNQHTPHTPLGPPPHISRGTTYPDLTSPYHGRTWSGASNGIPPSPAQRQPSIDNLLESPNATLYHTSPEIRRTSDYLNQIERERSVSVSPKTKVPPRPPSLGSRQSSLQEMYSSNRNSLAGVPTHVTPPHQFGIAPQPPLQRPNPASQVAHPTPSPYSAVQQPNSFSASGAPEIATSLSQQANHHSRPQPPPLVHHQSSQKMGMNHLLTPTQDNSPAMRPSPSKGRRQFTPAPQAVEAYATELMGSLERAKQESSGSSGTSPPSDIRPSQKRTATEQLTAPTAKQRKTMPARKYTSRPPWAQLSHHNPRFQRHGQQAPNGGRGQAASHPQQQQQSKASQPNGQPTTNGTAKESGQAPWLYDPPLDMDLVQARRVLGKWEKSIKWNTPYPDMLMAVQNWLGQQLSQLGDVGTDPREGTIEIEAKIGTLMPNDSDDRVTIPVSSMAVIPPEVNNRYHFESKMDMNEHAALNKYLNASCQSSHEPGRSRMVYKHLHEIDTFHALSPLGLQMLPPSLQRRRGKREPRLRVTHTYDPQKNTRGDPLARIVKIPIDNLHIYNPNFRYDCRISINLEVNLNRPDLDPDSLITQGTSEIPRKKDRLSYKHLAYSIDLTKVDRDGLGPIYELEVEMDTNVLRNQMKLMMEGKEHAFGDVVSGFLDNATFLMRQGA